MVVGSQLDVVDSHSPVLVEDLVSTTLRGKFDSSYIVSITSIHVVLSNLIAILLSQLDVGPFVIPGLNCVEVECYDNLIKSLKLFSRNNGLESGTSSAVVSATIVRVGGSILGALTL